MTNRLTAAIENLYVVFDPVVIQGKHPLFAKSLRGMDADELLVFSEENAHLMEETENLKHFLPRLLELTALLSEKCDISVVYERMYKAGWQSWDTPSYNTIIEFNLALWDNLLYDNSSEAQWVFSGYSSVLLQHHPDIEQMMDTWMQNDSDSSINYLTDFILQNIATTQSKELGIPKTAALKLWLVSEEMEKKLARAFSHFGESTTGEKIFHALKMLEVARSGADY